MNLTSCLSTVILSLFLSFPLAAQLEWVPYEGTIPAGAVAGGMEDNETTYICLYTSDLRDYPGAVVDGECFYWEEGERSANTFDILISQGEQDYEWVLSQYGTPPTNAFVAGYLADDTPFYLGRVADDNELFSGQVIPLDEGYELSYGLDGERFTWAEGFYFLTEKDGMSGSGVSDDLGVDDPGIEYDDDLGADTTWLWWILALVAIAVAVYFFRKRRVDEKPKKHPAVATKSAPVERTPPPPHSAPVATKADILAIKMLINEGELEQAADRLLQLLKEKSSDSFNEIIEYNAQLNELKQKEDLDRIAPEEASRSRSRIRGAMLRMLDRLTG